MLKDLKRSDWVRLLDIPEQRIPRVLILRGTRNLNSQYRTLCGYLNHVIDIGSPNGILENVGIGERGGVPVGFACVYGAPMASEVVHLFGVLGTRAVIQTGNCGALADGLHAGDIVVPTSAYCGEGAAQYYKTDGKSVSASAELLQTRTWRNFSGEQFTTGTIYTTSALFAEGEADIEAWYSQGYTAVDMETAATFAVAEYFGMQRLSILFVFDNPRLQDHLLLSDAAKDERRRQADDTVRQLVLDLAVELSTG